jgi:hypothetical protein
MKKQFKEEKLQKIHYLSNYNEIIGVLAKISEDEDWAILNFKEEVRIAVPLDQELLNKLKGKVGKRIGLLKTDIPGKTYLIRRD